MGNEAAKAAAAARKAARQARKAAGGGKRKGKRLHTAQKHANGHNGGKADDPRVKLGLTSLPALHRLKTQQRRGVAQFGSALGS